jgi:ferrochelatase
MDDIRPVLANVVRGRRVPPARLEEVAHHSELFGGVSPLTAITNRQAQGLGQRLAERKLPLPVYVGMRNWHPLLADTLRRMAADGKRRAVGLILAPHRSYSSCGQYRQNVLDARAELVAAGLPSIGVTYVGDWHLHPQFVETNAAHVRAARERLPEPARRGARLVFTAHSVPLSMAGAATYARQVQESAKMVAAALGAPDWTVVFQSRSGRPEDPWLGPDVCDYLRSIAGTVPSVVLVPIGFVCDHVEVLYDLDHEAAAVCKDIGLPMARAKTVNDDPVFLDMLADVVGALVQRYRGGRPLEIVAEPSS